MNVVEDRALRNRTFVFRDRIHAGEVLAEKLRETLTERRGLVLGIPAGGVPVASVVANRLGFGLDVAVVRKVQIPWNTEAGFGAVSWDGTVVLNELLVAQLGLDSRAVELGISKTRGIVEERLRRFRGNRPPFKVAGESVILVDDGLASGFTMLVAASSVKKLDPGRLVVAVPTGSRSAVELVAPEVDLLVCLNIRSGPVFAVADAYQKWYDLSDEEVESFLRGSRAQS
jgi:predicted phosphoribosyltransferase